MGGADWYVRSGSATIGPLRLEEVIRRVLDGDLSRQSLAWREGANDWVPIGEALSGQLPPPLPGAPSVAPAQHLADVGHATEVGTKPASRPPVESTSSWATTPPFAWRRFLARQLDILTVGVGVGALIGMALSTSDSGVEFLSNPASNTILGIIAVTCATLPNAIILATTGRSIGKLVFGMRVTTQSGDTPTFMQALNRELRVTTMGMFFGIPIFTLIAMWRSYENVQRTGAATWDEELGLVVAYRTETTMHRVLFAFGIVLILALFVGLTAMGRSNG